MKSNKKNALSKKARKAHAQFTNELENLLSYAEPKELDNILESVFLDWISTSHADNADYRTDVVNTFGTIRKMIASFDHKPKVAAQVFNQLKSQSDAVQE